MNRTHHPTWIAFASSKRIASGPPREVAERVKAYVDEHQPAAVRLFDEATSRPIEFDLRGQLADVLRRLDDTLPADPAQPPRPSTMPPRPPGRPKLGVTSREVTLLPRHWEWLAAQPGGTSVTLRRLVEQAQHAEARVDQVQQAFEAARIFMQAMAGEEPGFDEASQALAARDAERLQQAVADWPADIRKHVLFLAEAAFDAADGERRER